MSDSDIKKVKDLEQGTARNNNIYYVRSSELFGDPADFTGLLGGLESTPGMPCEKDGVNRLNDLLEVFEVEWLDQEREGKEFVTYRYEGIRINGNIYVPIGKVESTRSLTKPNETCLSVNGMFFSDRNGEPFSLVLATASLQD